MLKNSTFLYYYTLNNNDEECEIYDLNDFNQIDKRDFTEVYKYLDSLYVEAPKSLINSILKLI
jgi:hypothetical protein